MIADVMQRIETAVPVLAGRVQGAAELALLIGRNETPPVNPSAFVIPLGFDAGAQIDATSLHEQQVTTQIGVVLVIDHAGDHHGSESLPDLEDLAGQVTAALAGWTPAGATDCFTARRGRLMDASAGVLLWQSDFAINSFLRITPS